MTFQSLFNFILDSINYKNQKVTTSQEEIYSVDLKLEDKIEFEKLFEAYNSDFKFYFKSPTDISPNIAFGKFAEFDNLNDLNSFLSVNKHCSFKAFGGIEFNNKTKDDTIWNGYNNKRFVIPQIEFFNNSSKNFARLNFKNKDQIKKLFEKFDSNSNIQYKNKLLQTSYYPEKNTWNDKINKCLKLFENGELNKIVLSRRAELIFKNDIDLSELFLNLRSQSLNSYNFYYSFEKNSAFMGISPERLFKKTGNILFSDSLAGTRARGKNVTEDSELEVKLKNNKKELLEHEFVTKSIIKSLNTISKDVHSLNEVEVKKFKNVQHLYSEIKADLSQDINIERILEVLHPTPAVGGVPKEKSVEYINELEKFDRGWYAAPVGFISNEVSEFCVGIRSGLAKENKLYIYTGAGIVPGSVPEYEWEELNKKMDNFLNIINNF